jgi:hypothetical protein
MMLVLLTISVAQIQEHRKDVEKAVSTLPGRLSY